MLILSDGTKMGVVPIEEALQRAQEASLDLVEVAAPPNQPPVCRLEDFKKVLYEQKRKLKQGKKKAKTELKEVKMRVIIDPHDRGTKLNKARKFLEKGDKVKFTLQFRGREVTKPQLGESLVKSILQDLEDIAEVELPARRADRFIHMVVARRKDWKPPKEEKGKDEKATDAEPGPPKEPKEAQTPG